jgi:integrase
MANSINRLSDRAVRAKDAKGLYADGGGLYLQVSAGKSKSWIFRFKRDGKTRDMGLGGWPSISLADAREKAAEARRHHAQGKDPIAARDAALAKARLEAARAVTFKQCAEALIGSHEGTWRNPKHRQQWRNTLKTYAYPVIGNLPVADVDTPLVLKIIEPIWHTKTETAKRVRGRIERVLNSAKAKGFRQGENPAQWRGHLDQILPAPSKVRRVIHHPALPYRELPALMAALRSRDSISARALEFTILNAARTNEALGATFDEINDRTKLWTVPAERMKGHREHNVPLTARALAIVEEMNAQRISDYIFPGMRKDEPLSDMAMLELVRGFGLLDKAGAGITVHGFRSTFKDWAMEQTTYPDFLSEMALAHISGDKAREAYARAELIKKRRALMNAWEAFCFSAGAKAKPETPRRSAVNAAMAEA